MNENMEKKFDIFLSTDKLKGDRGGEGKVYPYLLLKIFLCVRM